MPSLCPLFRGSCFSVAIIYIAPGNPPAILEFTRSSLEVDCSAKRKNPSIAINDQGWVLQTYRHQILSTSYYRIGKITKVNSGIEWKTGDQEYHAGKYSQISMNDSGIIVEVSEQFFHRRCYYRVGQLKTADLSIEWISEPSLVATGKNPSLTLNNKGNVIVTYERGFFQRETFYRVGDIDIQYGIICWRGKEEKLLNHCTKVSVSLNNAGTAVFSFTQMGSYSFAVGFFGIDAPKIQQCMLDFDAVSRNKHTAVALNQHGHVISTWNKLNDAIILTGRQYKTSPIKEFKVNLDRLTHTNRNIQHMSIALNDKNTVVFAYHTTSGFVDRKKAVYTSLGKLERY